MPGISCVSPKNAPSSTINGKILFPSLQKGFKELQVLDFDVA